MLLAASYIAVLFHVPLGRSFSPLGTLGTPVSVGVLLVTFGRLWSRCSFRVTSGSASGPRFATVLGMVSMVPLTLLVHPAGLQAAELPLVEHLGLPLRRSRDGRDRLLPGWMFVISWNAIAMEAAACYIGECRDPAATPRSP